MLPVSVSPARGPTDEFAAGTDQYQILCLLEPPDIERLGGLPSDAIIGRLVVSQSTRRRWGRGRSHQSAPELIVNERFVDLLHGVIAQWAPLEPGFAEEALRQQDGWIYILDGRTPTPQGRVPPEDIIGAFELRGGKIEPSSYQRFADHELLTERGLFQLPPSLHERLMATLRALPPPE